MGRLGIEDRNVTNSKWTVMGWRGLDSVGWATVARLDTVRRRADHFRWDLGADRVYVSRDGVTMATFENGFWRPVADAALDAALNGDI